MAVYLCFSALTGNVCPEECEWHQMCLILRDSSHKNRISIAQYQIIICVPQKSHIHVTTLIEYITCYMLHSFKMSVSLNIFVPSYICVKWMILSITGSKWFTLLLVGLLAPCRLMWVCVTWAKRGILTLVSWLSEHEGMTACSPPPIDSFHCLSSIPLWCGTV